jgi:argininosuccinate synthase
MPRIVLAYSGGAASAAAIGWLKRAYRADLIALTLDFGQGRELEAIRDRALALGAARAHVLDVRDSFARDFVLPSLKASAVPDSGLVLSRALALPLIARKLAEIADIERADLFAHAAEDRTHAPLDALIAAVRPQACVVAVRREWDMTPEGLNAFAAAHRLAPGRATDGCRVDINLWGRSIECGGAPPPAVFTHTRPAGECPDEPAVVELSFERGVPRAINGVFMPALELIASLGTIAAAHGVGRVVEGDRASEAPAAVVLHAAHDELQARTSDGDVNAFARGVSRAYVDLTLGGHWFTPFREALDAFVEKVQEQVTGAVRLQLFKGNLVKHG